MGQKDAKLTDAVTKKAADLVDDLASLGDVTRKAMFGGQGIFESGIMFAMVQPDGAIALRADDTTSPAFIEAGGEKHGRMPYWSVSDTVLAKPEALLEWASTALTVAQNAKKKPKKSR